MSPVREHVMSTVSPFRRAAFGFAAAVRSLSTMRAFRFVQAKTSGVTPVSLAAFTRAPASISRFTVRRSSKCTAQWSAVAPFPRRVHIDALLQQGLHRLGVPALDGIDETQIARGRESNARREQHDPRHKCRSHRPHRPSASSRLLNKAATFTSKSSLPTSGCRPFQQPARSPRAPDRRAFRCCRRCDPTTRPACPAASNAGWRAASPWEIGCGVLP